jgi:hypothetical protein
MKPAAEPPVNGLQKIDRLARSINFQANIPETPLAPAEEIVL